MKITPLYHSELVKAGIVELKIKSASQASSNPEWSPYCKVSYKGQDRFLNLDSDDIADAFDLRAGQTVKAKFKGGKNNPSVEFIVDPPADNSNPDLVPEMPVSLNPPAAPYPDQTARDRSPGPNVPQKYPPPIAQKGPATAPGSQAATLTHPTQQGSAPPRPAPKPATQIDYNRERQEIERTCKGAIRLRNVVKLAFVNALKLKKEIEEEWPGEKISETQLQGFVGTLAIQLFRDGAQRGMPERKVEMKDSNGHHAPPAEPASFNPDLESADPEYEMGGER